MYRELQEIVGEALKVVKDLAVKSDDEEIRGYSLEYILKFSNLAAAIAEALGQKPERERNQLARRVRRHDRGGGGGHVDA